MSSADIQYLPSLDPEILDQGLNKLKKTLRAPLSAEVFHKHQLYEAEAPCTYNIFTTELRHFVLDKMWPKPPALMSHLSHGASL